MMLPNAVLWSEAREFCDAQHGQLPRPGESEKFVKASQYTPVWEKASQMAYYRYYGQILRQAQDDNSRGYAICLVEPSRPAKASEPSKPLRPSKLDAAVPQKDKLALAKYDWLKTEKEKPGSADADAAQRDYLQALSIAPSSKDIQPVTHEILGEANYQRLKLEREQPGTGAAWQAAQVYDALVKKAAREAKGSTKVPATGAILTRVTKESHSEVMARQEKEAAVRGAQKVAEANARVQDMQAKSDAETARRKRKPATGDR